MGTEQFLWITLMVISIDAFVILLFRQALFETWRRIYLRWMCVLLFFIAFMVVKEALDWASIFFWYFYSFLVAGLPFLVTFLFRKKERLELENEKQKVKEENLMFIKKIGYTVERSIPRQPENRHRFFEPGTNKSVLTDEDYSPLEFSE